jgi:hypothetical protein
MEENARKRRPAGGGPAAGILLLLAPAVFAGEAITPDLAAVARGVGARAAPGVVVEWVTDAGGRAALRLQSERSAGLVRLEGVELADGTIELDILGRSAPPQSCFIGVAFRVAGDAHDAVYFRPFNFRAAEPERRAHAVQYVSHPDWTWQRLRAERTGQYEKPIDPAPDGDRWFHARIEVRKPTVSVYVNGQAEPGLVVSELSDRTGGGVALWVGPGLGGHVANLTIRPRP